LGKQVAVNKYDQKNLGINLGGRVKIGGIFGGMKFEGKFLKKEKTCNHFLINVSFIFYISIFNP
jgi:hypothetical protein